MTHNDDSTPEAQPMSMTTEEQMLKTGRYRPRAPRHGVQMVLRYRINGEPDWREGMIENFSRSGVLFRADCLLEPGTPIEMIVTLPAQINGERAARVTCRGSIVRTPPLSSVEDFPFLAAKILNFRIARN